MNKLIYPTWKTYITIEQDIWHKYHQYFNELNTLIDIDFKVIDSPDIRRCEAMLWRLDTLYLNPYVTHILCRDLDAITTYRESLSVNSWIQSNRIAHGINDNTAHSIPLMGGMCGFNDGLKDVLPLNEYTSLKESFNLSNHGSDQDLLMKYIYPKVEGSFVLTKNPIQVRDNHLWESDLVCSFIGSAGVNEMELLRFFNNHDDNNNLFTKFEKKFSDLMYWRK
jgi:hypothetical protein